MSELSQVLLILGGAITVLVLLLVFVVILYFGWRLLRDLDSGISRLGETNKGMTVTLNTISDQLKVLSDTSKELVALPEGMSAVAVEVKEAASGIIELPKLVEGHYKVSMAMVAEVLKLREVISKLGKLLMGQDQMLTTYDDREISKELDIQKLIKEHSLTREDALEMFGEDHR